MGEHSLSARMQQKIDTTANWAKATNFVPKKGEIIVYSDGGGVGIPKMKVGDGTTKVGNLKFITIDSNADLSINGTTYNGSSAVSLSSQQLGVPSAFIAKSVSVLDCNSEKIGRVLSSSAGNSLVNGPAEIGSTGAGVLWNIPLSAPTSSINEADTQQKLYQIFVYDSGKVYLRKNSSNDTATWTYGTWEKLLTDVNITAENIQSALGYTPVKDVQVAGRSVLDGGVANVPIAQADAPGVVSILSPQDSGIWNDNGILRISLATDAEISSRLGNRKTIVCANMDYAVRAAMCDGKGAAWTENEQKAARERIGIDKPYELIEEITLTEGVKKIDRLNFGYAVSSLVGCVELPAVTAPFGMFMTALWDGDSYTTGYSFGSKKAESSIRFELAIHNGIITGQCQGSGKGWGGGIMHGVNNAASLKYCDKITGVRFYAPEADTVIPANAIVRIYGVRV